MFFGYSSRTIFRILAKGEGQFWFRKDSARGPVIKIEGIKNLFVYFDTCFNNTALFREITALEFNTPRKRRQALWASLFKPEHRKTNPISRDSLSDYTGVNRRRQQRYGNPKDTPVKRLATWRQNSEQPRLPNRYHSTQPADHKGMLVKVRRFLKSFETDEALLEKKCYFTTTDRAIKEKHRTDLVYTLVRRNKRLIPGRIEYEPNLIMVGL